MAHSTPLQYDVTDGPLLAKLSEPGLKVVEVYSSWCGTCHSVIPTFKRLRAERSDEATLQFLTVAAEKCALIPQANEHVGHSQPLFLFFRNGTLKHRVDGANTPDLATHILALTPLRPDTDEPQDNPMRALLAQQTVA